MRKAVSIKHGLKNAVKDWEYVYSLVELDEGGFLSFIDSGRVSRKRVNTLFEKEPTTLMWLDGMARGERLFDVGANVGMYTVYAAAVCGLEVRAFEPESLNYADLNKNIHINGMHDHALAYCIAVSDCAGPDTLYLSTFAPSYSHHDFGVNRWEGPVTKIAASQKDRPKQGCFSQTLNFLSMQFGSPHHVKIDVDGFEYKVVDGGYALLKQDDRVKTVLIEMDFSLEKTPYIMQRMQEHGWVFSFDQVCTNRQGKMTEAMWKDHVARKKGGCNIIYFRNPDYFDFWKEATKDAPPYKE